MSQADIVPIVGISACRKPLGHGTGHSVVDKYVDAVIEAAAAVPLLIPAFGEGADIHSLLARLDGVLLTGSPSNVEPDCYGGERPRPDNQADTARDSTVLPLIRAAIEAGVPLLGVCRGIQEVNVALGGSLHQHLHEVPGRLDHRSIKTLPPQQRYEPRHEVRLSPGGVLARILGGRDRLMVNSLHAQGIDRLADGLEVEAEASDGTIEAVSVKGARSLALAVQWHPEWRAAAIPQHRALFEAFAEACRERARQRPETRTLHDRLGAVA